MNSMGSKVKYTRLSDIEFGSTDFSSIYDFSSSRKSYFTYSNGFKHDSEVTVDKSEVSMTSRILESGLIICCYILFVLSLPVSLIFCLRFVKEKEKFVLFRLGRLQNSKGPGAVIMLPCIDRWQKVDMGVKAFHIPPMTVITSDGGIVELGATVFYNIKDAVQSVLGVKDLGPSVRTLAQTVVHREINKRQLSDIDSDKRAAMVACELKTILNECIFSWGAEISELQLSSVKVIKKANSAVSNIFSSIFGGGGGGGGGGPPANVPNLNGFMPMPPALNGFTTAAPVVQPEIAMDTNTLSIQTLVGLMEPILTPELVRSIGAVYQFQIADLGDFYINLREGSGHAAMGTTSDADVTVSVRKEDCWRIFSGQVDPFEAYMRGEIQVTGNLQVAMKLQQFRDVWANHCRNLVMKQH